MRTLRPASSTLRRPARRAGRAIAATVAIAAWASLAAGCGSAESADDTPRTVTQTIEIVATEYSFSGDPATVITAGETVRIVVRNDGGLQHELQLLDTESRLIDRTARLDPGTSGEITVTFESPGVYQVICDVDDHFSRGQQASFTVG